MACIVCLVTGVLYAVVLRDDMFEGGYGLLHRGFDLLNGIFLSDEMHQVMHRYGILAHVEDGVPGE